MRKYSIFTKAEWDNSAIIFYTLFIITCAIYSVVTASAYATLVGLSAIDTVLIMILAMCCIMPLFFIIFANRFVAVVLMPFIFYFGGAASVIYTNLNEHISVSNVDVFFDLPFIFKSSTGLIFFLIVLGIAIGVIRFLYAKDSITVRKGQAFAFAFILAVASINVVQEKFTTFSPMPYSFIGSMQDYFSNMVFPNSSDNISE